MAGHGIVTNGHETCIRCVGTLSILNKDDKERVSLRDKNVEDFELLPEQPVKFRWQAQSAS